MAKKKINAKTEKKDWGRETIMKYDWKIRGYFLKFLGYLIFIMGIIIALYNLIILHIPVIGFIAILGVTLILGGLSLLFSWIFLPDKK